MDGCRFYDDNLLLMILFALPLTGVIMVLDK